MQENVDKTRKKVIDLPSRHHKVLAKAVSNILSTSLALKTFAEIVDGQPTRHHYKETLLVYHAEFEENLEPSRKAQEIFKDLQRSFTIDVVQIHETVRIILLYGFALLISLDVTTIRRFTHRNSRICPALDRACSYHLP